jgi:hypothetical protein
VLSDFTAVYLTLELLLLITILVMFRKAVSKQMETARQDNKKKQQSSQPALNTEQSTSALPGASPSLRGVVVVHTDKQHPQPEGETDAGEPWDR